MTHPPLLGTYRYNPLEKIYLGENRVKKSVLVSEYRNSRDFGPLLEENGFSKQTIETMYLAASLFIEVYPRRYDTFYELSDEKARTVITSGIKDKRSIVYPVVTITDLENKILGEIQHKYVRKIMRKIGAKSVEPRFYERNLGVFDLYGL